MFKLVVKKNLSVVGATLVVALFAHNPVREQRSRCPKRATTRVAPTDRFFFTTSLNIYERRRMRDEGQAATTIHPSSLVLRHFSSAWRPLLLILAAGIGLRLGLMWAIWANGGSPLIGDEGNYILSALPLSE